MATFFTKNVPSVRYFYAGILFLAMARVLTSKVLTCPPQFDCETYIKMADTIRFDPLLLPHHAMRVLPSLMAGFFHHLGLTLPHAFQLLSGSMYAIFGLLTFLVLRQHQLNRGLALGFTLLCLAPHHAMRIPLQNVYQACDIMTYPLSLMMIHFSLRKQPYGVLLFALIGVFTKQTLFILGEFSLLYCFWEGRKKPALFAMGILAGTYFLLQHYYQALDIMVSHVKPVPGFFTPTHLISVIEDSRVFDLIIPIVPFLLVYIKPFFQLLFRYWHLTLYMGVVIGQPFLFYHNTGNNFQRLALQGVWIAYFLIALIAKRRFNPSLMNFFVFYSLGIYFIWSVPQRLILMVVFSLAWGGWYLYSRTESNPEEKMTLPLS